MKRVLDSKKAVVFDLDGTLAKSKLPIDREIAKLLGRLTRKKKVAVIGGGKFQRFWEQVLLPLQQGGARFENLFLFPTNGAMLYHYRNAWKKVYEQDLTGGEVQKIKKVFTVALKKAGFVYPSRRYGIPIENRRTQVTFSALGQNAPLPAKMRWNRREDTRPLIARVLKKLLPGFEISIGGLTSIDVTKKGIDKAYAVRRLMKILRVSKKDVVFVGDALFPGGNDYSVKSTGVECICVKNPAKTKRILTEAFRA